MTRRPLPRRLTIGLAGIGIATALAGCSTGPGTPGGTSAGSSGGAGSTATYKDGTYTQDGSYVSPAGTQSVTVKLTLAANKVTAVTVTGHATDSTAKSYQSQFISGISDVVVGKDINSLSVSRVAGSSLTSGGFNAALTAIKAAATS